MPRSIIRSGSLLCWMLPMLIILAVDHPRAFGLPDAPVAGEVVTGGQQGANPQVQEVGGTTNVGVIKKSHVIGIVDNKTVVDRWTSVPFTVMLGQQPRTPARNALWVQAPTCTQKAQRIVRDKQGQTWGWDPDGQFSCAVRNNPGPVMVVARGPTTFATAPRCIESLTSENNKADSSGNYWGWEDQTSCAYKDATGKPLALPVTVKSTIAPAPQAPLGPTWEQAPTCPQDAVHLLYDTHRQPWGWDQANQVSCAVRDPLLSPQPRLGAAGNPSAADAADSPPPPAGGAGAGSPPPDDAAGNPTPPPSTPGATGSSPLPPASADAAGSPPPLSPLPSPPQSPPASAWEQAPVCPSAPNKNNSVQDDVGHLWGQSNDQPCAYRLAVYDTAVLYDGDVRTHGEAIQPTNTTANTTTITSSDASILPSPSPTLPGSTISASPSPPPSPTEGDQPLDTITASNRPLSNLTGGPQPGNTTTTASTSMPSNSPLANLTGGPQPDSSSTTTAWDRAPTCPSGGHQQQPVVLDQQSHPWSWDQANQVSCAVRSDPSDHRRRHRKVLASQHP